MAFPYHLHVFNTKICYSDGLLELVSAETCSGCYKFGLDFLASIATTNSGDLTITRKITVVVNLCIYNINRNNNGNSTYLNCDLICRKVADFGYHTLHVIWRLS